MGKNTSGLNILASINTGDIAAYAANEVIKQLEKDLADVVARRKQKGGSLTTTTGRAVVLVNAAVLAHPIAIDAAAAVQRFPGVGFAQQAVSSGIPYNDEQVPTAGIYSARNNSDGYARRHGSTDAVYEWLRNEDRKLYFYVDTYGMVAMNGSNSAVGTFPTIVIPVSVLVLPKEAHHAVLDVRALFAEDYALMVLEGEIRGKLADPARIQREAHAELVRRALLEGNDPTLLRIAGMPQIVQTDLDDGDIPV